MSDDTTAAVAASELGHRAAPAPTPARVPQKTALKDITYGSVAGMVSKVFEHPFDLVKVRLQSQPHDQPARFRGPVDCFRRTIAHEGVRGLYRGVSMPIWGAMAENATLFMVYNQAQRAIRRLSPSAAAAEPGSPLSMPQLAAAAGVAGACTSFVLTPIELIKCRMQVQRIAADRLLAGARSAAPARALPGAWALTRATLKEHGPRGMWLGQTGTLLRETGGGAAWFGAFELAVRWFVARDPVHPDGRPRAKADLADWQLMLAGACGGVCYNVVLFPADSIKSAVQTAAEMGEPARGFLETGKRIFKSRGWRGLYAGCGITCLRSGPSSALIFWIVSRLEGRFD